MKNLMKNHEIALVVALIAIIISGPLVIREMNKRNVEVHETTQGWICVSRSLLGSGKCFDPKDMTEGQIVERSKQILKEIDDAENEKSDRQKRINRIKSMIK